MVHPLRQRTSESVLVVLPRPMAKVENQSIRWGKKRGFVKKRGCRWQSPVVLTQNMARYGGASCSFSTQRVVLFCWCVWSKVTKLTRAGCAAGFSRKDPTLWLLELTPAYSQKHSVLTLLEAVHTDFNATSPVLSRVKAKLEATLVPVMPRACLTDGSRAAAGA